MASMGGLRGEAEGRQAHGERSLRPVRMRALHLG